VRLAYQAYDKAGRIVEDTIEAANATEAGEALRRRGLYISRIRADQAAATRVHRRRVRSTGKRLKNLAMFTRQMFVLISTGTPIVQALKAVERQTRDAQWKQVIVQLRQHVEEGRPLSEAMAEQDRQFDPIYRSLVAAGESAGKLPVMLDRLALLIRKQQHVRNSIMGAMIYPMLLIAVSFGVLILMLTFVLPRFTKMFESMDVPLPPTTVIVMWMSEALRGYWWAIVPGTIGFVGAVAWWLHTDPGRRMRDTVLLRCPGLGAIVRSFASAKIARLLGILLNSHLPMLDVLGHVKQSTPNVHYMRLIERAEELLTHGEPISGAFSDEKLITPSVYEAIRNGEDTGEVAKLCLTMAEFLDQDNDVVIKSLSSILEPAILILMGVLVGFLAVSMFLPLFDMTAAAGG
jgi:type II secretory pathway component PulF